MNPCFFCSLPVNEPDRYHGLPSSHFYCDLQATLEASGYDIYLYPPREGK